MTNYNERLDGILDRVYLFGMNGGLGYEKFEDELSPKDAKQAITSLIKELVAEARIDEINGAREDYNKRIPDVFERDVYWSSYFNNRLVELKEEV